MTHDEDSGDPRASLRLHGYAGLLIILAAEALLFSGNQFVGHWFTPIVWTGFILFVDALVFKLRGKSLLVNNRSEFLIVAVISIGSWWLFEFYNEPRFWRSDQELWWHYHNVESNPFLRRVGYDWAFATISPAMFEAAQFFQTKFHRLRSSRPVALSNKTLYVIISIGALCSVLPIIVISTWFAPLVWLGLLLMLDPLNYFRGLPSITGDLKRGDYRRPLALLASGALCGVLWEFWNYWALTKWTYTVPYFGNVKLFEMPVLGYLGFPFFAVETWVIYVFIRGWVLGLRVSTENDICPVTQPPTASHRPPSSYAG
jgi:hypothetical protein